MTAKELLQTKLSYYQHIYYNSSYKKITLYDWISNYSIEFKPAIDKIREMYDVDKTAAKKAKAKFLPAVTISGIFNGERIAESVSERNPIIAIDIDKDDNNHITDWDELKNKVASLPYVFLTSYSCSGKGIYCLVYYNVELDFVKVFNALQYDFRQIGINIDSQCKDISRLRFISYDSNMLIRQNDVEQYNKEKENEEKPAESFETDNNKEYSQIKESDAFIYQAIYYLIKVDKYRANDYASWLQNGFYLSTFGELGFILFMLLSQLSAKYDEEYAKAKFVQCKKSTRYNKDCLIHYFGILKEKHGPQWKQIIKDYKEQ